MAFLDEFTEIVKLQEPLAPYTYLKLGGPAQALAQPRSVEELSRLVQRCLAEQTPFRILGGGCNVLVRDEGVHGVVIRLSEPAFAGVEVKGHSVRAGAGASLSSLISAAARNSLAGVESLIGIPGSVGGALRTQAGSRAGDILQRLKQVHLMDPRGQLQVVGRDELDSDGAAFDGAIILAAEFDLEPDNPDEILKRMRKFWIHKKAHQPLSFEAAGRIFKDPRGLAADQLIEQAGLQGTRVGGAEISERHANFIVANPGATSRDVLRLIDLMRSQVAERLNTNLQLDIVVW